MFSQYLYHSFCSIAVATGAQLFKTSIITTTRKTALNYVKLKQVIWYTDKRFKVKGRDEEVPTFIFPIIPEVMYLYFPFY